MGIEAKMITIDCAEPRKLADWWVSALGASVAADYGEFVMVAAAPLVLGFQRVPESKQAKNRVHVDFSADDYAADVKRLADLGAEVVGENSAPGGLVWTTLRDPEGNEFDVSNGAE
jgi:predicted enzyme related to lactoylglutathione lyase